MTNQSSHHGVVHFEIPASDPDKLSQFYSQLFGWNIQKMEMGGTEYWVTNSVPVGEDFMPTERGAINGGIYKRQDANQMPTNYVNVESVDQYVNKAHSLGAKVLMGKMPVPQMGWYALLQDPDGNPFGVWQNDTSAA
jgi:predicted enzyme related to lactoylglutathione lyase